MKIKLFLLLIIIIVCCTPWLAIGEDNDPNPIYKQWEDAALMRGQQQYSDSETILRNIITDHQNDQNIRRRAWCEIIFSRILGSNLPQQREVTREALLMYPDLVADTVYIPETVNTLLENERRQMFGSLTIREPAGAEVFLDNIPMGVVPLFLPYVEVGEYDLMVTLEGHEPYNEWFIVDPEGRHLFERIPLIRQKNAWYWISRLGGGAVVTGTIVYFASQTNDAPSASPLPGAPALPGTK